MLCIILIVKELYVMLVVERISLKQDYSLPMFKPTM